MDDSTIRINKFLASAGFGSRRGCEQLVNAGRVTINGTVVEQLSTYVQQHDEVCVDGRRVHPARTTVLLMLNKPQRYLTANRDDSDRPLAIDLVRPLYGGHLFPVGRLDFLSSGLLIFTNDGDLTTRLLHPSYQIEREYIIETGRPVPESVLKQFQNSVTIDGEQYRLQSYKILAGRRIRLVLTEGKNREIRKVLQNFNTKIKRIHRIRYGGVSLGKLAPGQARPLTISEATLLYRAVDLKVPILYSGKSNEGGQGGNRN